MRTFFGFLFAFGFLFLGYFCISISFVTEQEAYTLGWLFGFYTLTIMQLILKK